MQKVRNVGRGRRLHLIEPRRILRAFHFEHFGGRLGVEHVAPCDRAEERAAQSVDVGAVVDGLLLALLRRHVPRRAGAVQRVDAFHHAVHVARDAEVRELDCAVRSEEQVGRLDVAVNDPVLLGVGERPRRVAADRQRFLHGDLAVPVEQLLQRPPGQELHREIEDFAGAVRTRRRRGHLRGVVHLDDVRMVELRGGPGLLEELGYECGVFGQLGRKDFQGDRPVERDLRSAIDGAHRSFAEERVHSVAANHLSEEFIAQDRVEEQRDVSREDPIPRLEHLLPDRLAVDGELSGFILHEHGGPAARTLDEEVNGQDPVARDEDLAVARSARAQHAFGRQRIDCSFTRPFLYREAIRAVRHGSAVVLALSGSVSQGLF
jgi:hypothetical protein